MIREALQYMVDLGINKDPLVKVGDKTYSMMGLQPVKLSGPEPLEFNFLDSLVTYLLDGIDPLCNNGSRLIIQIKSPTKIALHTEVVGDFNERFNPVVCTALVNDFPYGRFIDPEEFIIMAQSRFVDTEDLAKIRQIVGNVKTEDVASFSDDGVSQQITAKTGVARVDKIVMPPRVRLAPYRTFVEVEQPESDFVFRAKKADMLPLFALCEADGGAGRIEAIKNIKVYLEEQLADTEGIVILG